APPPTLREPTHHVPKHHRYRRRPPRRDRLRVRIRPPRPRGRRLDTPQERRAPHTARHRRLARHPTLPPLRGQRPRLRVRRPHPRQLHRGAAVHPGRHLRGVLLLGGGLRQLQRRRRRLGRPVRQLCRPRVRHRVRRGGGLGPQCRSAYAVPARRTSDNVLTPSVHHYLETLVTSSP